MSLDLHRHANYSYSTKKMKVVALKKRKMIPMQTTLHHLHTCGHDTLQVNYALPTISHPRQHLAAKLSPFNTKRSRQNGHHFPERRKCSNLEHTFTESCSLRRQGSRNWNDFASNRRQVIIWRNMVIYFTVAFENSPSIDNYQLLEPYINHICHRIYIACATC